MRSSDWLPIATAPLNPYGQAYGPIVMLHTSDSDWPVAAYFDCQGSIIDNQARWVTADGGQEIDCAAVTHWMPIAAPWSGGGDNADPA